VRAEDLGEDDDNEFADQPLRELHFVVDELDYQAIMSAIAARQTVRCGGTLVIADGQGDLGGRILAQICRGWINRFEFDREGGAP
jgi:hypothetical protein